MNLKICIRALLIKAKQRKRFSRKFAKSYVSLFLVLMIAVTGVFAWFTKFDTATINSMQLELKSASSLRVNEGKQISNEIKFGPFTLDEASSVDGRNIYFPLSGSFSDNTNEMIFREGNYGDQNLHYVYQNFELTGTSDYTEVYIKSYRIRIAKEPDLTAEQLADDSNFDIYQDEITILDTDNDGRPDKQVIPPDCPVRLSFIQDSFMEDSSRDAAVIDPSASVKDYVENTDAVFLIDDEGSPTTKTTTLNAFSSYYFGPGNQPVFILRNMGVKTTVTMIIWLEGTAEDIKEYLGRKIFVDIDIESNFVDMEQIYFVDDTLADEGSGNTHWISNDNPIIAVSYRDPFNTSRFKTVIMNKTSNQYEWTAQIPKTARSDISFYRLNSASDTSVRQGTIYNSWHTNNNVRSQVNPNIDSSWYNSGSVDLQTTREYEDSNGKKKNSTVYKAIHGNGFGNLSDPDHSFTDFNGNAVAVSSLTTDEQKMKYWLSPCIGYWQTTSTPIIPTDPENPDIPTGDCKLGVSLNNHIQGKESWFNNDAATTDMYMHLTYPDSSSVNVKVPYKSYNRFEITEDDNLMVPANTTIDYFFYDYTKDGTFGGTDKQFSLASGAKTVTSSYNYSFELTNDDTFSG